VAPIAARGDIWWRTRSHPSSTWGSGVIWWRSLAHRGVIWWRASALKRGHLVAHLARPDGVIWWRIRLASVRGHLVAPIVAPMGTFGGADRDATRVIWWRARVDQSGSSGGAAALGIWGHLVARRGSSPAPAPPPNVPTTAGTFGGAAALGTSSGEWGQNVAPLRSARKPRAAPTCFPIPPYAASRCPRVSRDHLVAIRDHLVALPGSFGSGSGVI